MTPRNSHIVTCAPKFIEGMIIHTYSKETVHLFLDKGLNSSFESCHIDLTIDYNLLDKARN